MTTNWRQYVRNHLPPLDISAERELEIVDELALQLEAAYDAAVAEGANEAAALARAYNEVPDWDALAKTLSRIERPVATRVPTTLRPSADVPALGRSGGGPPSRAARGRFGETGIMSGFVQDVRYAV